jgi:hypothetical protein
MFADSIESLLRNVIQKQKIDMANEVIDAGSFDNLTNDAERRQKLEAMLLVSTSGNATSHRCGVRLLALAAANSRGVRLCCRIIDCLH